MEVKHVSPTHYLTLKVSILLALGNLNSHSGVWSILAVYHAKLRLFGNLCTRENQSKLTRERDRTKSVKDLLLCQENIAVIKIILIDIQ